MSRELNQMLIRSGLICKHTVPFPPIHLSDKKEVEKMLWIQDDKQ